jgi:hypothetical protein
MADIIEFPKGELTPAERKKLEEFVQQELAGIADTSCETTDEIQDEIMILVEYFRKFMDVLDNPDSKINPDLDFGLFLLQGRIQKIRGMLKDLFQDK